ATWMRALVLGQGVGMLAFGVGLFAIPDIIAPSWPWTLTTLTARAIGAWLIGIGVAALHANRENDVSRIRPLAGGYTAFALLELVAIARFSGNVNWSAPGACGPGSRTAHPPSGPASRPRSRGTRIRRRPEGSRGTSRRLPPASSSGCGPPGPSDIRRSPA